MVASVACALLGALAPNPASAADPPASAKAAPAPKSPLVAEADRLAKEVERLADEARYGRALELALTVLGIREKELGPDHPKTATALSDVAALRVYLGDSVEAEPLIRRAVAIFEKTAADADPIELADARSNLSSLLLAKNQPEAAKRFASLALEGYERSPKPDPSKIAGYESHLALVLAAVGEHKKASELYRKAIATHEKTGPERALALDCVRYGSMLRATAQPGSEIYLNRGYRLAHTSVGPAHPLTAQAVRALGRLFWGAGSASASSGLALYQDAYSALEGALGEAHPNVADLMQDWAVMRQVAGDLEGSLELRRRADAVEEVELERRIAAGPERDAIDYAKRLYRRVDRAMGLALSLGQAMKSKEASRYAAEMVLRRKGQVLDVLRGGRLSLRKRASAEERKLFGKLAAVRAAIAEATLAGPGADGSAYRAKLKELEERERAIEAEVTALSKAYREASSPVSLAAVQAALPEGSVLVEIFRWRPEDARALADVSMTERYVALVIDKNSAPRPYILGDAKDIDRLVREVRRGLSKPDNRAVYDVAYRLGILVVGRLEAAFEKSKHVFIAPDGELNLLPYGALIDAAGKFYIQKYSFTYLSSGRDLLRLASPRGSSSGRPALFANPRYGERGAAGGGGRGDAPSGSMRMRFPPLPGTQAEAEAIAKIIPGLDIRTDEAATEGALKAVVAPSVLHVATHGFFLAPSPIVSSKGARGLELVPEAPQKPEALVGVGAVPLVGVGAVPGEASRPRPGDVIDNPMLRSGLAFVGANALESGEEDGILTALEASALDLDGTELVVLSACETGVGDVERGQGVFSLRRALALAGAETQVMSLWEVDDEATKTLMSAYYEKLFREGKGRSEALREAELAMLGQKALEHPYYWAAFIASGDPSPLRLVGAPSGGALRGGGASSAPSGRVPPPARGCGCAVPGAAGGDAGVLGVLLVGLARLVRRSRRSRRLRALDRVVATAPARAVR